MAISSSVTLLLVALLTTAVLPLIPAQQSPSPSPSPSLSPSQPATPPPQPPVSTARTPPPAPADIQENQLKNIVDALIGAGDFGGWANVLSSADPSAFPLTATLFIPSDDATSHYAAVAAGGKSFDPFLIPYHIVPQRLTFSNLRRFAAHTRLPTLLPSKFIIITNNSASNFTIDDSQITQADIFTNAAFAVHGVNDILNYTVYGGGIVLSPPPVNTHPRRPKHTVEPPKKRNPNFPGETTVNVRSSARRSCNGILRILAILVAIIFVQEVFWTFQSHQEQHEHRQSVQECAISYRWAKGHRKNLN